MEGSATPPGYQRFFKLAGYALVGLAGLGGVLSAMRNASALISILKASVLTGIVVASAVTIHLYVRKRPLSWVTDGRLLNTEPSVIYSSCLRSLCLTRFVTHDFGEAGNDAFTIMKLMGHSTITVSQRYVHPSPESMELAVTRLEALNDRKLDEVDIVSVIPSAMPMLQVQ